MKKSHVLNIVEDPLNGDLLLELTEELCNSMGWNVNDTLVWENVNNRWTLRKQDASIME